MNENLVLFEDLPEREYERVFPRLKSPVWTANKAHFIARYLALFVLITKHGTYIDGFAGPQDRKKPDAWSAKLVLENEPHWFRHFHLCELNRRSLKMLRSMVADRSLIDSRGREIKQSIRTYHGDFNLKVEEILSTKIEAKEATFCLLDQRTFECHWHTVVKLANHKPVGSQKIEIFYFLAVRWLHRSLSGVKGDKAEKWWGRSDWQTLRRFSQDQIVEAFVGRFEKELGYKWVKAFPIYAHEEGEQVQYHMIHASDHDEAPGLMFRAYNTVVKRNVRIPQPELLLDASPPLDIV